VRAARAQAASYQKAWDSGGSLADRMKAEHDLEVNVDDAKELAALLANLGIPETIQNILGLQIKVRPS
jgi:adenylate cyclase class IV